MSLAQLTPVYSCGQVAPSSNPHTSIYYNTFAKKKKKTIDYTGELNRFSACNNLPEIKDIVNLHVLTFLIDAIFLASKIEITNLLVRISKNHKINYFFATSEKIKIVDLLLE